MAGVVSLGGLSSGDLAIFGPLQDICLSFRCEAAGVRGPGCFRNGFRVEAGQLSRWGPVTGPIVVPATSPPLAPTLRWHYGKLLTKTWQTSLKLQWMKCPQLTSEAGN